MIEKGIVMIVKRLMDRYAMSETGAKGFLSAVLWTFLCNLGLMVPVFLTMGIISTLDERLSTGTETKDLMPVAIVLSLVVLALIFILHYMQYKAMYLTTFREGAARRISLAESLRRLPMSWYEQKDLSDLTNTLIMDSAEIERMFSHYVSVGYASFLSITVIGIMMLLFNWRMGIAILWVFPAALLTTFSSKAFQNQHTREYFAKSRRVTATIQESIDKVRDIRAFSGEKVCLDRLREQSDDAIRSHIHSELATSSLISASQAFIRLGLATAALEGTILLVRGQISLLFFIGFMFAAARIYDPINIVLQNIAATFNTQVRIERLKAIRDTPRQVGTTDFHPEGYDLKFSHVSYAYQSDQKKTVLKDVSFTARQGQVTALVGASGSGKSTIARLAARFYDISSGTITLGGTNIQTVDPETLLTSYSIVFQDVVLFNDTIMENIRLGRHGATDEEVLAAAKAACCDDFVSKLPDGYQTVIGENGARLSGGERQRISIARALLKNAPVVLLDEATASLDVENESQVQAAISRLTQDKTVIVIAHRMRTIENADHVIVLDQGRIVEEGTPQELLRAGGRFAHMAELQNMSSAWEIRS
ncbi:MAG: ABC transporter ATP-binding protein [Bulleidia sp.]|nr:ABC transporter ATP-binding protein [Bulleidia sp.]